MLQTAPGGGSCVKWFLVSHMPLCSLSPLETINYLLARWKDILSPLWRMFHINPGRTIALETRGRHTHGDAFNTESQY